MAHPSLPQDPAAASERRSVSPEAINHRVVFGVFRRPCLQADGNAANQTQESAAAAAAAAAAATAAVPPRVVFWDTSNIPAGWRHASAGVPFHAGFLMDPTIAADITYVAPDARRFRAQFRGTSFDSLGALVAAMCDAWCARNGGCEAPRNATSMRRNPTRNLVVTCGALIAGDGENDQQQQLQHSRPLLLATALSGGRVATGGSVFAGSGSQAVATSGLCGLIAARPQLPPQPPPGPLRLPATVFHVGFDSLPCAQASLVDITARLRGATTQLVLHFADAPLAASASAPEVFGRELLATLQRRIAEAAAPGRCGSDAAGAGSQSRKRCRRTSARDSRCKARDGDRDEEEEEGGNEEPKNEGEPDNGRVSRGAHAAFMDCLAVRLEDGRIFTLAALRAHDCLLPSLPPTQKVSRRVAC